MIGLEETFKIIERRLRDPFSGSAVKQLLKKKGDVNSLYPRD